MASGLFLPPLFALSSHNPSTRCHKAASRPGLEQGIAPEAYTRVAQGFPVGPLGEQSPVWQCQPSKHGYPGPQSPGLMFSPGLTRIWTQGHSLQYRHFLPAPLPLLPHVCLLLFPHLLFFCSQTLCWSLPALGQGLCLSLHSSFGNLVQTKL
jgi:hypothetical protein